MNFIFPESYNGIILAFIFREKLDTYDAKAFSRQFERRTKRLKREYEEEYLKLRAEFTSIEAFCDEKNYQFVIRTADGVKKYGNGPKICYDTLSRKLHFQEFSLYYLPRNVKQRIKNLNDLVKLVGVSNRALDNIPLDLEEIQYAEEAYHLKCKIWTRQSLPGDSNNRRGYFSELYTGDVRSSKLVHLHYQEETEELFSIDDVEKYFENYFICKNFEKGCHFQFRSKAQKDKHEQLCDQENLKIEQIELCQNDKLIERAISHHLIPPLEASRDFVFYDIEAVLPRCDIESAKTRVTSTHKLLSIAVNR